MFTKEVGKVKELYITKAGNPERIPEKSLSLDEQGVINDKFHGKELERSVLIASKESYEIAQEQGIEISHGLLGENILIDYNLYHFLPGDTFAIGSVIFEITQNCTICKGLSSVDAKLPKLLKNDRGIFAKVLHSGEIKIGDTIRIKEN